MSVVWKLAYFPAQLSSSFCSCCKRSFIFRNFFSQKPSDPHTWYVSFTAEEKQLFHKYETNVMLKRLMRRMGLPVPYKLSTYSVFLRSAEACREKDRRVRGMNNIKAFRNLSRDQIETLQKEALESDNRRQQEFFKSLLEAKENYKDLQEPSVAFSAWQSLIFSISNFKVASRVYERLKNDEIEALNQKAIQSQDEYMKWMKSLSENERVAYLADFLFTLLSGKGIRKTQKLFSHTTSRYNTWHAFLKSEYSIKVDRNVNDPAYMSNLHKKNLQIYLNLDEQSKQQLKTDVEKRSLENRPRV